MFLHVVAGPLSRSRTHSEIRRGFPFAHGCITCASELRAPKHLHWYLCCLFRYRWYQEGNWILGLILEVSLYI